MKDQAEAMGFVAAVIVSVWVLLVGTAYCCRKAGLTRPTLIIVVTSIYAALAAGSIVVLGATGQGWFGAAGMLFPYAVALILVFIPLNSG